MNNHPDSDDGAHLLLDFGGDNLDPAPLMALIPLTPNGRPIRKGEPMSQPKDGRPPFLAKRGYCGFTTDDRVSSGSANDHVRFLLGIVQDHIEAIREIVRQQSLTWTAWLFEGDSEGQKFSDMDPALLRWAADLGLPLRRKEPDRLILVYDVPKPGQQG
ncbi:MAG TPA: DUF4279 domain-containing protein [Acetobacteraceae bacterium]|nr:DUF4279 domain-containing protein [Acetobacteraceae bacterium]